MKVTREQILEWTENPVTLYLKEIALDQIEGFQDVNRSTDVFHPFEPQKTQEVLAGNNAAIDTWEDVVEALEGEGVMREYDSEDEEEEPVGY